MVGGSRIAKARPYRAWGFAGPTVGFLFGRTFWTCFFPSPFGTFWTFFSFSDI